MGQHTERKAFSAEQCEALFAAVLIDDEVDEHTALPEAIHLEYSAEQISRSFELCRQVWNEGVDRAAFARTIEAIGRGQPLDAESQLAYKHVRAKFKHLRFAYAGFDARHSYPLALHLITIRMGLLQDAFKNGEREATKRNAVLLRLLLVPLPFAWIRREIGRYRPASPESFRRYMIGQIEALRRVLSRPTLTGKEFHETRKIVSRQVALFDSLRTLYPSEYHNGISRYLAAINGLMGRQHDELIVRRFAGREAYKTEAFALSPDIRSRLETLSERYPHGTRSRPVDRLRETR